MHTQDLCDQQSEPATTNHSHACARPDGDLLNHAAGGGRRLDEHRRHVVERWGHCVQVRGWQCKVLGECSVPSADADHGAHVAVATARLPAPRALSAANRDLADDAAADPFRCGRARVFDNTDKLVAGHTCKSPVAANQLEIGAADTGSCHANQTVIAGLWPGPIVERQGSVGFENNRAHGGRLSSRQKHDMMTTLPVAVGYRLTAAACAVVALGAVACAQAVPKSPSQPASKPAVSEAPPAAAPATKAASKALIAKSPDGTRIAYETSGSGPVLMLLHGGGQTRTAWNERGYVDRLSKRFTVITVDQRGSGDSDKPATAEAYALDRVLADLLAVADSTGAKRFHLWGYGHGASVGRYLAARSDRVISAVLVGATMGPTVTGIVKDAIVAMRTKWQPLLEAKQAGTLDLNTLSPGDRSALNGGTPLAALALGALVDYPSLEPGDIKTPTLWVVGGVDTSVMENVKTYEGKLAGTNVSLKLLSSANYSDCFVKIDEVLAAVEPFLAQAAPAADPSRRNLAR